LKKTRGVKWKYCLNIKLVHRATKEGEKRQPKKDPIGKSVRTSIHVRHSPDLPGGEITIEVTSTLKHCTTATKKSTRIEMGWKKEMRREHCSKIELALPEKEKGKNRNSLNKTRSWRGKKRVYVLPCMFVTFPTCQVERSPLKATAL
jgi:hypothetical protein